MNSRIFMIAFLGLALHFGWKHWGSAAEPAGGATGSTSDIAVLAAKVGAEDVVMYSTTECAYCAQAKGWLKQYDFAYTECNMSVDKECERQFLKYGATGTPYLVVKGQHMKDGFDSQEFLSLLRQ
jgi:glutaredoxin